MIPLTESLRMAFQSVLRFRELELPEGAKNLPEIATYELNRINTFLNDNCAFKLSDDEIRLLFRSFQYKRTRKKQKNVSRQLSLYV